MSITLALSNALSGLTASSRMAEVVASNTANAMTEGYARREVQLSSQMLGANGAGVAVTSINRAVNETVLQDRRLADASAENAGKRTDFYSQMEGWLGNPEKAGSLSTQLSDLEASFVEAASRPESESRLTAILEAAKSITTHLGDTSDNIQQARMDADQSIGSQVNLLNESLAQIDTLNSNILSLRASGNDASTLLDQRQVLVDQVSTIVPVRQIARDNDQISLVTTGGAFLLESNPVEIGFSAAGTITADMTQDSGALSGLTINGMDIATADDRLMGGGSLGALFSIRDELAPQAQTQVDAYARNLIERFSDPATDPTLSPGSPGLFTDAGGALDTANELGLGSRISINAIADPDQGGALWHLRDGLGATSAGSVGNSQILTSLADALTAQSSPSSGDFGVSKYSASSLAASLMSEFSSKRQSAEATESFATARHETLNEMALADGVDTDQELQTLLQVERMYAANAKVMQTVDTLINTLLEL
ncbi:flagellar hook-associated protein FlgK [Thioclava sp.]|uniref:flagellar hook-associated protein FlgK n=1 Tax=Thioclava sp. TaxID=1933450 RepID=UPI003AA87A38